MTAENLWAKLDFTLTKVKPSFVTTEITVMLSASPLTPNLNTKEHGAEQHLSLVFHNF